ncbi:MAG: relaxase, partial [Rhodospirillales bacterium]
AWLTDGIRERRLELNQVGALVHVVPEGLLLVSPRIFKVYAGTDPESGRHWEYVQRRLLRKRWHRVHARGRGIFEYQVSGERKTSRLKGIVLTDPTTRLNLPLPEANRHLTRVTPL